MPLPAGLSADAVELMQAKLKELGPEFIIASDLPRIWATGAQAFITPEFSMVIFREQNVLGPQDGGDVPIFSLKNVASIIMPTPVLLEFHQQIGITLAAMNAPGEAPDGDAAE
jgi:hypothetical protein